jgi:hypothetical protein
MAGGTARGTRQVISEQVISAVGTIGTPTIGTAPLSSPPSSPSSSPPSSSPPSVRFACAACSFSPFIFSVDSMLLIDCSFSPFIFSRSLSSPRCSSPKATLRRIFTTESSPPPGDGTGSGTAPIMSPLLLPPPTVIGTVIGTVARCGSCIVTSIRPGSVMMAEVQERKTTT